MLFAGSVAVLSSSKAAIRTHEIVSPDWRKSSKIYRRKRRFASELGGAFNAAALRTLHPGRKRMT